MATGSWPRRGGGDSPMLQAKKKTFKPHLKNGEGDFIILLQHQQPRCPGALGGGGKVSRSPFPGVCFWIL